MASGARPLSVLLHLLFFLICTVQASEKRQPPKISEPNVAREEFYRSGETVTLKCDASGKPTPTYRWFWNSQPVTASTNDDISVDSNTGTLTITSLDEDKEGFFNCHAQNTFSNGMTCVAVSPKIEVRKGRIEDFPGSLTEEDLPDEDEYSYYYLYCDDELPVFYGRTQFVWYRVTAQTAAQTQLTLDDRQFTDSNGTLHFSYLTQDDDLDNDFYACGLSNAVDGNIRVGSRKRLSVDGVEGNPVYPPSKRFPPDSHTVTFKIGYQAQLECFFSGKPSPTITWQRGSEDITTADRYTVENHGRILKISNLIESDEGNYNCIGSNSEGSATASVYLNVTAAPIWTERLQERTKVQSQDAVFTCETRAASGENTPESPKWYKNNQPLDNSTNSNKYQFSDANRTLTVKSVQKNMDIVCFQCYVNNSVGEVFSDGCLNVILPITILTQSSAEQEIAEGDIVNLTATASSDPLYSLSYKWIFKNVTYQDPDAPPLVTYDAETKVAFINTSGFSDDQMSDIAGLYQRYIYHPHETVVVDVDVTLEDTTVVVPVTAAGFDYWIIGLIIGILLIILVIIIICCVCRRKMLEGDYPVDRKETAAGLDPERELKDSGFHDLSRADYDYLPEKKPLGDLDFDENIPLGDDESFGEEYGDEAQAFTEDGSFIGVYSQTKKEGPPGYQSSESNV